MEESRDILMSTLIESGVLIPGDFSTIGEFSSEALISICAQLLNLIDPSSSSISDESADTICTEIANSVKNLGYIGDISYYKFLHPSEDDSYRLIRFLVERIKASPAKMEINVRDSSEETFDMHIQKVEAVLKDLTMTSEISESPSIVDILSLKRDEPVTHQPLHQSSGFDQISSEKNYETVELQNQRNLLLAEVESGSSELCSLDCELELLNLAAQRLLDDSYLQQLNQQLVVKRCNIMELKKQWDDVRLTLETKKLRLLDQLHVEEETEAKEKFHKLRKTELDLQSLSSEIQKREDEWCNLYAQLEKQPKAAPRKSYIHGIKEITKNSRKLDTDIQRISGETRVLQLESNSIRERLHRSYALVDEMVTREVKKDPAVRQVYKLLTSINGIFEQISEKILLTDRLRREAVDYEKKLRSITARGMSLEKLQTEREHSFQ